MDKYPVSRTSKKDDDGQCPGKIMMLMLFCSPEDGDSTFIRNAGIYL
jgi:hypothetical protein